MGNLQQLILIGGLILVCGWLMLRMRRTLRAPEPRRDYATELVQQQAVRERLDELLIEIQQVSRDQIARIDTKIRVLNQLVAEADQRIAELRAASGRGPAPTPARETPPLHRDIYRLADEGFEVADIARKVNCDAGEIELILSLRKLQTPPSA